MSSLTPHQRFRHGSTTKTLEVRKDRTTGEHYNRLTDIQRTFLGAQQFEVNGVVLNFLEDENDQEYDPKRIAHHPDDIIDIVTASPVHTTLSPPVSPPDKTSALTYQNHPSQLFSASNSMGLTVSNLSLQPIPASPLLSSLSLSNRDVYQTVSIARPMAVLSSIASDIIQLQHQLDRSTDQQLVYHQQLLERLVQLLQKQEDAKERDEQVLAELAAAKERD
ncbi:hypothetical protein BGX29_001098, partial [Mortierella sp. GBA35]